MAEDKEDYKLSAVEWQALDELVQQCMIDTGNATNRLEIYRGRPVCLYEGSSMHCPMREFDSVTCVKYCNRTKYRITIGGGE